MNRDHAAMKIAKLRAHAASADKTGNTGEATAYWAAANKLAAAHDLPRTPHPAPEPGAATPKNTTPKNDTTRIGHAADTPRRTTSMPTTGTTTPRTANHSAADRNSLRRESFERKIRSAFGANTPPGTEIVGRLVRIEEEPDTDYRTRELKFNEDGTPRMVPILILQTDGTLRPIGNGLRKLWVRTGVADALADACLDAGQRATAIGGRLRIKYVGLGTPPSPGFAAPKLFEASYEPPVDQEGA